MTPLQFALLGTAELQSLNYGSTAIVGDNNASNKLVAGAVFAVRTNVGNYAKVRVVTYGYDLAIRLTHLPPQAGLPGAGHRLHRAGGREGQRRRQHRLHHRARRAPAAGGAEHYRTAEPQRGRRGGQRAAGAAPDRAARRRGWPTWSSTPRPGHLVRIQLASGAKTNVAFDLDRAIGLLVTGDHHYAFVAEQSGAGGRVRRVELDVGAIEHVIGGFTAPFMMTFNDASESAILMAERDPANRVSLIDLGARPMSRA